MDNQSIGTVGTTKSKSSTSRTSSRGRSKERLIPKAPLMGIEELQEENQRLMMQIERERQRSKRLSKKLKELKEQSNSEDNDDNSGEEIFVNNNSNQVNLKEELKRKDNRIAELEQLVSSLRRTSSQRGLDCDSSNHDSLASLGSHRSKGSDAIWNRLQTQLNETREELSRTEELLRAQTANLLLQTNRVEELEQELKTNGIDSIRSLREKCNLLTEEKKELESRLQTDRRELEDRLQKKDEALIYFRNELQKLKQTNVDPQRSLVHASSQHSFMDGASTHSTQSSTVQRAFGGISHLVSPALWSKEKVSIDRNSLDTPKLDL